MNSPRSFYTTPGPLTDPGEYAPRLDGLPNALPELVRLLQGLAVHIFWAGRYGLELSEERRKEVGLRSLRCKLARIGELDPAPLNQPRPAGLRLVSNCRDFATVITGMLIHQGAPARARCGFGVYFMPNHYEDHWVGEYWNEDQARWVMFDPQLDEMMCETLKLPFDPLDMPAPGSSSPEARPGCCAGAPAATPTSLASLTCTAGISSSATCSVTCWRSTRSRSCPGTTGPGWARPLPVSPRPIGRTATTWPS
ncbi:MAG: transglutaminase domain-containing protein [Anaerolineaceae bacterium]